MGRPDTSGVAGFGLDHAEKHIVAESPLVLEVDADVGEQFVAWDLIKQCAISAGPPSCIITLSGPERCGVSAECPR